VPILALQALTFARSHWKLIGIAALAIFAGTQTLRLAWTQTALEKLTAKIAVMAAITNETDKKWRATESTWKVKTAQIVKDKDNEIQAIDTERDAASSEVANRPRRPAPGTAQGPADGEAASGCTGARLFGDDAEFLIREAARADTIRVALKSCYAQYDMISEAP